MRFAELVSAASIAAGVTTVLAEDAPRITNNPQGGVAFATIKTEGGRLEGVVAVSSGANGQGAEFVINLNGGGPPFAGGPFMYHVHEKALASSGDCGSAGAHLDPTKRGESPGCDATKPETCQVGDLSGKYGNCEGLPGCSRTFRDDFTSLIPGTPAYIGDKSFVIHSANKTRIACANFVFGPKGGPQDTSNGTATTAPAIGPSASASASSLSSLSSAFSAASSVVSASSSSASAAASAAPAPGAGTTTGGVPIVPPANAPAASPSSAAVAAVSFNAVTSLTGFALSLFGLALW